MAVYIVTGKLGAGKTLLLIIRILAYLKARRRVAVNVDVKMEKLCKPGNKYSRLVRLPDLPSAEDLIGLGVGCDVYDEEKFGGIFLDEAGVWLNSRDWNSGGRTDLLKFFLFLRKRRWDLWLCVQHVNVIDKQVRESIAEHVVYINRWDKLKIPLIFRLPLQMLSFGRWKGAFLRCIKPSLSTGQSSTLLKLKTGSIAAKSTTRFTTLPRNTTRAMTRVLTLCCLLAIGVALCQLRNAT